MAPRSAEALELDCDGIAKVNLTGAANSTTLRVAGIGEIHGKGFTTNTANVTMKDQASSMFSSDKSAVELTVLQSLQASMDWHGQPYVLRQSGTCEESNFGKRRTQKRGIKKE